MRCFAVDSEMVGGVDGHPVGVLVPIREKGPSRTRRLAPTALLFNIYELRVSRDVDILVCHEVEMQEQAPFGTCLALLTSNAQNSFNLPGMLSRYLDGGER